MVQFPQLWTWTLIGFEGLWVGFRWLDMKKFWFYVQNYSIEKILVESEFKKKINQFLENRAQTGNTTLDYFYFKKITCYKPRVYY